jgi:hypothetical protein
MAEFLFELFSEMVSAFVEMGIEDAFAQTQTKHRDKASRGLGTI